MTTVFENAEFISCEDDNKTFSVMATNRGRIVYTGDDLPQNLKVSRRVDLGGATVMPVFGDTHVHFESYAMFMGKVDLRAARDFDDMSQMLRDFMKRKPKTKLLPAFGCSAHSVKEKRLPELADLDKMLDTPFIIVKYDGHAAVANSAFIAMLPEDVKSDPGFNADTGWLYQNAFYKAVNFATSFMSPLSMVADMEQAAYEFAKKGVGYIHAVEGIGYKNDIDIDTLRAVRYGLPQRIRIFFQTPDTDKVVKRKMTRVGGCFSMALDGCFGSKDAAVIGGYADDPENSGFLLYTQEEINEFCVRANRLGLQIALHAIGDAAVEQALNAYEAALKDHPREDHRHIIIHADLIPPHMIERAAAMGIYIPLQPNTMRWPQEPPEYLESILGKRFYEMFPLRDMIDAGIFVSGGSDAPATLPGPIESIYNCCNHVDPAQSITPLEALKMHTLWTAKTSFDEKDMGSLTVGKFADFTVLSANPLKMPVEELRSLRVTDIYFGGKLFDKTKKPSVAKLAARILVNRLFYKRSRSIT